jgi:tricorn protease-like protein
LFFLKPKFSFTEPTLAMKKKALRKYSECRNNVLSPVMVGRRSYFSTMMAFLADIG